MPDPQRRATADSECLLVEGGDILPVLLLSNVDEGGNIQRGGKKGVVSVVAEGMTEGHKKKRKRKTA